MFSARTRSLGGTHHRIPASGFFPAFCGLLTNVASSFNTSLIAEYVVASPVLPRNGSLARTTGPASRSRVRVGNGFRMNDCEVRSMSRMSPAMPHTCRHEEGQDGHLPVWGRSSTLYTRRTENATTPAVDVRG